MGRYQFELATRADDAELRAVLSATPMEGQVSVSFRREPSFFDAAVVEGDFHQVIVCRDRIQNRVAGFGCRSVREMYVNGTPRPVGYLSALRALPEYRNVGLVARGYALLRRLHADGRTQLYLTTIAEGNERALATLTSARAGLPTYAFAGNYHTLVVPIVRARRTFRQKKPSRSIQVRQATVDDRDALLAFLQTAGPARQFFPCYQTKDFFEAQGTFRDLAPANLLLAFRDGRLVGTLGGWDQHAFRQSVVERYGTYLRWSRPLYNAWAWIRGLPGLPEPGTPFRYLTGALPVVQDNDATVFRALLDKLLRQSATGPCDYLLLGLHESDPLLRLAEVYGSRSYLTRTYLVCWNETEQLLAELDDRPNYLELGCL